MFVAAQQRSLRVLYKVSPVLCAFLALMAAAFWKHRRGLAGIYGMLRSATTTATPLRHASAHSVADAVRVAAVVYPFNLHCLVRSAATVAVLRCVGVSAALVLGVRHLPFASHAWVEVSGQPLAEEQDVSHLFVEIDRL